MGKARSYDYSCQSKEDMLPQEGGQVHVKLGLEDVVRNLLDLKKFNKLANQQITSHLRVRGLESWGLVHLRLRVRPYFIKCSKKCRKEKAIRKRVWTIPRIYFIKPAEY